MSLAEDDQRLTELETLEAIYPEISRVEGQGSGDGDALTFDIELPVRPTAPVTVTFPAATGNDVDTAVISAADDSAATSSREPGKERGGEANVDSLQISHLPSLRLRMSLPYGYPDQKPPSIRVSAVPPWLRQETLVGLEQDGPRLWEEAGRDMVAFTYIDHVQRLAEDVFGAVGPSGVLEIDPEHKLTVLDHNINAKKAAFDNETFDCGVCLDPKKGNKCHKMLGCEHIFCIECLQEFYDDAISQGYLPTVRCLAPNCAKERAAAATAANGKKTAKSSKAMTLTPSELLQIGLSEDQVKRYVNLKYKTELESDKNTIYCPRQWCHGAARSKNHKKPSGLEFADGEDDGDDDDDGDNENATGADDASHNGNGIDNGNGEPSTKTKIREPTKFNRADLLAVCEDCGFAFCSRCQQSWHGEFFLCSAKRDKEELTAEEKASLDYLKLHTSPCPTCEAPAQKTHGCNHMICARCDTHFCYLCCAWLDPVNPYKHYNQPPTSMYGGSTCYMRLWELEHGDGNDVGQNFDGGQDMRAIRARVDEVMEGVEEVVNNPAALIDRNGAAGDGDMDGDIVHVEERPAAAADHRQERREPVAVAREAPLVLRLIDDPVPNRAAPPAAPPPQQQAARRGENHPRRGGGPNLPRGAPGRGGRGGRGDGVGRVMIGAAANQEAQPRRRNPQQAANGHRGALRGGRGRGRGGGAIGAPQGQGQGQGQGQRGNVDNNNPGLDPAQEAWIRNFVQMALIDAEDQVEDGSDDDENDNNLVIR